MTGPRITPPDQEPLPLNRLLTPEEFQQAQVLSPAALKTPGLFPALPPVPKNLPPVAPPPAADPFDALPPVARDIAKYGVLKAHSVAHALAYPFQHPLDFALGVIRQPVNAAFDATMSPSVGEARPNPNLSKGGNSAGVQLNAPAYDAEHGAVTDAQRNLAGFQTAVNAAAPALGPLAGGAAAGAANSPDDPVTGAIAGAIFGKTVELGVHAVGRVVQGMKGTPAEAPAGEATAGMERTPEEQQLADQYKRDLQASRDAVRRDLAASRAAVQTTAQKLRASWQEMHAGADQMAAAKTIVRATTGSMAAQYEQAAFQLDQFRRLINPLTDQQKLSLIDAIETGPRYTEETPEEQATTPHQLRMAQINGGMAARAGDAPTVNPYVQGSPLHDAWAKGHSAVPAEDIGAENVLREGRGTATPTTHPDLAEDRTLANAARPQDSMSNMERTPIDPAFHPFIDAVRNTLDNARDQIRALGTGKLDDFIENYFPHIWDDPDAATDVFRNIGGKGPFEGPASFLKERSIPTTREGIEAGLKPVSTNPIDLVLLKTREMQRYLMAHQSMANLKDAGLVKYVPTGGEIPDGYGQINDKIATVFGPRQGAVTLPEGANIAPEDVGVLGRREMGRYWAPEPVAGLLNNYFSPGLPATLQSWFPGPTGRGAAMVANAWKGFGNTVNQFQLGLSAFHLGFTSLDATTSRTALALGYLADGKPLEAVKKMATAPVAALPGIAQGLGGDLINAVGKKLGFDPNIQMGLGAKIRQAYLNPENASPEMRTLAEAVQEAGGRVRSDSYYNNGSIAKFMDSYRNGQPGGMILHAYPALIELAAKPIMEHIVPLQKLQVFGELAQKAAKDLPADASLAERRAAYQSAWDSADNRMGQLVYDNLFWNKTFKDLAMLSTRSVGWNIGTIRELGGGVVDAGKYMKDLATPGVEAELTPKAAYAAALPFTVGLLGAAYQYLKTGQGPQELKDYFYPKTGDQDADGNPDRVQLPSYWKDVFAYYNHPAETIEHKLNPLPNMIGQMLSNQDYYGDEIRNPHDPVVKEFQQESEYLFKNLEPFGFRNAAEQNKRGDDAATKIGSFFGITPAPREVVRTPAENLMHDYARERGSGGATPEMVEARQDRATILAGLRGKSGVPLDDAIQTAIEHGSIVPKDLAKLMKRAGMTPDQASFKTLSLDQAMQVWKVAKESEKAKFAEILAKKIERASK